MFFRSIINCLVAIKILNEFNRVRKMIFRSIINCLEAIKMVHVCLTHI